MAGARVSTTSTVPKVPKPSRKEEEADSDVTATLPQQLRHSSPVAAAPSQLLRHTLHQDISRLTRETNESKSAATTIGPQIQLRRKDRSRGSPFEADSESGMMSSAYQDSVAKPQRPTCMSPSVSGLVSMNRASSLYVTGNGSHISLTRLCLLRINGSVRLSTIYTILSLQASVLCLDSWSHQEPSPPRPAVGAH